MKVLITSILAAIAAVGSFSHRVTDPREIVTATGYDLAGRQMLLTEDSGGALERQTAFAYNRLNQLTSQTAQNKSSTGSPLAAQATHFRYDSLGRLLRTIYPDSAANPDSPTCTDCVTLAYDFAGRATSRTDQRGQITTMAYDRRSLLLTRTTDVAGTPDPKDTFAYDALGRVKLSKRGTTVNDDAMSSSVLAYTDLGDLDYEDQIVAEGTARRVDYGHDQAGNRTALTYPGGSTVGYTPTALNQVAEMTLKPTPSDPARPLVKYDHVNQGHVLENRRVTTDSVGGNSYYDYTPGYDTHRRLMSIANRFTSGGGSPTDIATYSITRDNSGNPLTQTTGGLPAFADDRTLTPDRLNRVISTAYTTYGGTETSVLDRVGNRETHAPREGSPTAYTLANAANEYATIDPDGPGGAPPADVTYDAAGNLETDEDGRWYAYDEHDRLTNVWNSSGFPLAEYYYDALGRRVQAIFYDPNTSLSRTARYYYDGSSVIEERDGSQPGEPRTRYHVNGAQYIDEHIATYTDGPLGRSALGGLLVPPADGIPSGAPRSRAGFTYYLQNDLYTVTGVGEADGTISAAFTYDAAGRPTIVGGGSTECQPSDADCSGAVNLADVSAFVSVLLGGTPCSPCAGDAGGSAPGSPPDGLVDGRDMQAFVHCLLTGDCPTTGGPSCTPGDLTGDGQVTTADVPPFVNVLLTGPANADELCRVDMGGPNNGPPDGVADGYDLQALVNCLVLGDCPPGGGGGAPATTDNTFYLHGAIVDQLDPDPTTGLPRLLMQYNRARYYDLRHARWLQRDPTGYADGGNLYEGFGGNPGRFADPMGTWTEEGVIDAFTSLYGADDKVLYSALEILSRHSLEQGTSLYFNDYWVDHKGGRIFIADDNCGFERSNANAAYQLYRVVAEEFYGTTDLPETWEGWTVRMAGATGKTVGGGLSVVGGGLLLVVPEPTMATKVGGAGAIVFGSNTVVSGVTQFRRRPGGEGIDLIGEAADLYQEKVQGELPEEWYLRSRTYVGIGGTAFELAAGGGFSKFMRTAPLRALPSATQAALTRGYERLASRLSAPRNIVADAEGVYQIRIDPRIPGRPDPRWSVDTSAFSEGVQTANGGIRNSVEFWNNWLTRQPQTISPSNAYRIQQLELSPRIDSTWIQSFPEHGGYLGETLFHHHVGQGPFAIPVPASTHIGFGSPWH